MTRPRERLWPTLVACGAMACGFVALAGRLTNGFESWTFESLRRQQAAAGALVASPVVLRDAQGDARRAFDRGGDDATVYLVDFIYTTCPSVCQSLGAEFTRLQQAVRDSGTQHVKLLSISIDPLRDGREQLAAHARLHGADAAIWRIGAPQEPTEGQALQQAIGVVAVPDGAGGFVHNGSIHLIDGRGRVHAIFELDAWQPALVAAQALARERQP